MNRKIEIIPNEDLLSERLFKTQEDYYRWRESFMEKVKPELDKLKEARRKSERDSFFRIVN